MTAVSALAPVTYRQLFGEAQLQVPNGYGPMAPPNRNLACLCGEVFSRGVPPWPHNVATATLVYLCLLQGARPAGTHFSSLASLPSELFTQWSPVMVDLLLKADPYLPQDTADRLLSTMCARAQHNAHTVAVCELLAPLHSGATSLPTSVLLSYSSTRKAATASSTRGSGASGAPGPTRTRLENLPPLASVFVQTAEHTPATAQLVKLLLTKQPSEVLRHPLPLLLGLALRSAQVHTASTATVVKALIDAHDRYTQSVVGDDDGTGGGDVVTRTTGSAVVAAASLSSSGPTRARLSPQLDALGVRRPHSPCAGSPSSAQRAGRRPRGLSRRPASPSKHKLSRAALDNLATPKAQRATSRYHGMAEPLRLACCPGCGTHTPASVELVRIMLHNDPSAAAQRVSDGRLAMHSACGVYEHTAHTVDIVNILIGAHRAAVTEHVGGTARGRLPLHEAAVRTNHTPATVSVVKALLRIAPAAAYQPDPQFAMRLPAQLLRAVKPLSAAGAEVLRLLRHPEEAHAVAPPALPAPPPLPPPLPPPPPYSELDADVSPAGAGAGKGSAGAASASAASASAAASARAAHTVKHEDGQSAVQPVDPPTAGDVERKRLVTQRRLEMSKRRQEDIRRRLARHAQ